LSRFGRQIRSRLEIKTTSDTAITTIGATNF